MSTLTIRNLEDALKNRLRLRAAARNRSMEEEARQILRSALQEPTQPTLDLGARIRARFAALGDVRLPIEARQAVRPAPVLAEAPAAPAEPEDVSYQAVEKEGTVTAIWEMQGQKHLRTIDPRSNEGKQILALFETAG